MTRQLLRAAQRRARHVGLSMSYRSSRDVARTKWYLSVEGNSFLIAAWAQKLERDLPVVAEGYTGASVVLARRFAASLVARFVDQCIGDDGNPAALPSRRVVTYRVDEAKWWWPVLDHDFPALPAEVLERLRIADGLVGKWLVDEAPAEIVVEEVHTIVEVVLVSPLTSRDRVCVLSDII